MLFGARTPRKFILLIGITSSLLTSYSHTGLADPACTDCSIEADIEIRFQQGDLRGLDIRDWNFSEKTFVLKNLTDAILVGAKLKGVDFSYAILNGAKLSGADMTDTKMVGSYLYGADLSDAILINANFTNAMLWLSDLKGADFTGANLQGARLWGANVHSANLSYANLSNADFSRADLTNVTITEAVFCNTIMPTGDRNDDDCS